MIDLSQHRSLITKEINFPLVPREVGAGGSEAGIFIDCAYLQYMAALSCKLSDAEFCHL